MLRYLNLYNTNRVGLHTYTDASDKQQYLYSQFEAFHCFHVFPVFDQPDLKAKMTLTVLCPTDWVTVGNSKEKRYETAAEAKRVLERNDIEEFPKFFDHEKCAVYEFEQTPRISCYLYAMCAGSYKVHVDYDPMHTPQRIFVRQSMDEFMRAEMVFGVTKTTIDFYQKNFGARYPFSKVDHVMCPDYKYGAMENVGCITYSDSRFFHSKNLSVPDLTWVVVVIQHELCHMWFGNLVTMKWWDDLWLNEAFATALSYKACSMGGPHVDDYINEAWLHMSGYKRWGLSEDLMPSNHKIQADCPSTDTAESLIDGITYGKGSSLIKQLIFLIGW
jgi:aminopeptidase N